MPTAVSTPNSNAIFRHVDGGFYRYVTSAKHTDDESPLVVYEHVWPFERGGAWARPQAEWAKRFTMVDPDVLAAAMMTNREQAQAAVHAHKAARRAAEKGQV